MAQKICPTCGKTFSTRFNNQFCSAKCKHASDGDNLKTCEFCGISFIALHKDARFCSVNCYNRFHYKPKPVIEKTCPVCGKIFSTNKPLRIYCSPECYRVSYKLLSNKKRDSHEK